MEGVVEPNLKKQKLNVCYLNLHLWLSKDTRTLIWKKLTEQDKFVVKKAHGVTCYAKINFDVMITRYGYLNLLKWWRDHNKKEVITSHVIVECAFFGHVHILEWIIDVYENSIYVSRDVIANIAINCGHLDILKLLCDKSIPLNFWELLNALKYRKREYPEMEAWLTSKIEILFH
jgi:hypothetical protein